MKKNKDKNKVDLAISKQLMFYKKKKDSIITIPRFIYHDFEIRDSPKKVAGKKLLNFTRTV